jgi:sugar/nucleoside kinase (ribokinase family)
MKILGIGNALVDIMTLLESDDFLKQFNLQKGSMQLVDQDFSGDVLAGATDLKKELSSGGSAANTIHGLAHLGMNTGYIGKIGKDDFGEFFKKDMERVGIKPSLLEGIADTGRAIALVSPDSERTFATFLGAAIELNASDLVPEHFIGYDCMHVEGYLVQNRELITTAMKMAKEHGLVVSIDLASYNVVEQNVEFLTSLITQYVDIVFANEEEAKAFTGLEPLKALDAMAEMCDIAVVKLGKDGSAIKRGQEEHRVIAIRAESIDTTGAGDLYASGFLYGLMKGLPLMKCGDIGSVLSGKVIEVVGAKMTASQWNEALSIVEMIEKV